MEKQKIAMVLAVFMLLSIFLPITTAETDYTCFVYFTGVGCPHCAKVDPMALTGVEIEYDNIIAIEYEIYQQQENAPLLYSYDEKYGSGLGVPLAVFSGEISIAGDSPIQWGLRPAIQENRGNGCPLLDAITTFDELEFSTLPGSPKLWSDNRVLIRTSGGNVGDMLLRGLLSLDNITSALKSANYQKITPVPVALSGTQVVFENAVQLDGWVFQWNGEGVEGNETTGNQTGPVMGGDDINLTWAKIFSLAAVDAVNPCAIAVLSLMLIAIITYNPKDKRNILLAGAAFIASVYTLYLVYGLVIIRFFQVVQALTSVRLLLYQILGAAAVIMGVLNIRDFFSYKPGSIGTEMPLSMRPRVKKIINSVTSPRGAFLIGAFVTIFLLPCTIGPYIIAGGILSAIDLVATLPMLLVYNIIFVIPMIVITMVVYAGITGVENVSEWKDKNIRYMHLIAGIIIFLLGIAMLMGWV